MRYYVHVENGLVTSGPHSLSSSESVSPNVHWGLEQMKLNGYLPADLSHDPMTEKIDYANPVVTEDLVVYNRIPLSGSESQEKANKEADRLRRSEYPSIEETLEAVYESLAFNDDTKLQAIVLKRSQVDAKYPKS